jgi:hypothetical protein
MSLFLCRCALFLASTFVAFSQGADVNCEVVLVDVPGVQKLMGELLSEATPEQLEALAAKFVRVLGQFAPTPGEESLTTKRYPIPGTALTATASVYFTDETMGGDSISIGLVVADQGFESAFTGERSVSAVTSMLNFTYLNLKRGLTIASREHVLKLECTSKDFRDALKSMSEDSNAADRKKSKKGSGKKR